MGFDATGGQLNAVVLAAGEGTRMRSQKPKPLHELCGRAMVLHVLEALHQIEVEKVVVVVGHQAHQVMEAVKEGAPRDLSISFAHQEIQRGTGDAVGIALELFGAFDEDDDLLVIPADTPLLTRETLTSLVRSHRTVDKAATILTTNLEDPTGYGRILHATDGRICGIVEHGDASEHQRMIREINTSIYCFRAPLLGPALRRISNSNAQGELYLTDVIGVFFEAGFQTDSVVAPENEVVGVNDRVQLSAAERTMQQRICESWMRKGVSIEDPSQVTIDVEVVLHADTHLSSGTQLKGRSVIGSRCTLGPLAVIIDSELGDDVIVETARIEGARVGHGAYVESFTTLRRGEEVTPGQRVGPPH